MGLPGEKPRRATYADLEAVPPHEVAEIIDGVLHVFPRPASPHARTASRLGVKLGGPFDLGEGGPGGWHILGEPELHFGPPDEKDVYQGKKRVRAEPFTELELDLSLLWPDEDAADEDADEDDAPATPPAPRPKRGAAKGGKRAKR